MSTVLIELAVEMVYLSKRGEEKVLELCEPRCHSAIAVEKRNFEEVCKI